VNFRQSGAWDERGGAAVEFALVLPVLLIILFAILEYGWYLTYQITLSHAVMAGARTGVKAREWDESSPQDPEALARSAVQQSFWISGGLDPYIVVDVDDELTFPRLLEVKVLNLPYSSLTGYLPDVLVPKTLSAKAVIAFP